MAADHLMRNLAQAMETLSGGPLLIGCSGGMDSSVLLHALASKPQARERGLRAIHVHHGLHPDADAWASHVGRACAQLSIGLTVVRADVQLDSGDGIEAAARHARHAAFEKAMGVSEILVLAHHREDQAETFLLRALRASGPDGLGAMRVLRPFGRGWLWRPLLRTPKSELAGYARAQALSWVDDPSNADVAIARNFLRGEVLPLLRARWPDVDAAFARSAELSAQASDLLDQDDAIALARASNGDPHILQVERLCHLDATRRARLLRRWVQALGLPPLPAQGVVHIERDLLGDACDREPSFAWSGAIVRRWRTVLHAGLQRPPWPDDWSAQWNGMSPLQLPDASWLHLQGADGFDAPVRVTGRRGGERMTLPGRTHSHALKHLLQDADIPPWERACLPLLFAADGALVAAGERLLSASLAQWLGERGACLRRATDPD